MSLWINPLFGFFMICLFYKPNFICQKHNMIRESSHEIISLYIFLNCSQVRYDIASYQIYKLEFGNDIELRTIFTYAIIFIISLKNLSIIWSINENCCWAFFHDRIILLSRKYIHKPKTKHFDLNLINWSENSFITHFCYVEDLSMSIVCVLCNYLFWSVMTYFCNHQHDILYNW